MVSPPERQVELAHELFRIWTDNVWEIGTVGLTPLVQRVVVVNADLRNVPEVAANDWPLRPATAGWSSTSSPSRSAPARLRQLTGSAPRSPPAPVPAVEGV